jgi:acetyltransferase-like isoleucine patch superfamily enzyme
MAESFIHETAQVSDKADIGKGTKIWNWVQVRENTKIGKNCILSKSVYIDFDVKIGNNVKIQNNVSVYHGVNIEDGVFIGPHVCFTNDKNPRAINPDGTLKSGDDWEVSEIKIKKGAAIGANSTILPGVTVGRFALVGAGSVVTKNIPDFALVYGNPAKIAGYVCKCGKKLENKCNDCNIDISEIKNDTHS